MKNDNLMDTVGTVVFSMPEMDAHSERAAVLLHVKLDDHARTDEVLNWLMEAVVRAGGELHVELCGEGDTTSPT
jgi:hypothetical protein